MLTLLICAYNEEKDLPTTLMSLSNQIDKDFNIVLVDNNSKDKTAQIIKEFQRHNQFNSIIYVLEKNPGRIPALTRGIREASKINSTWIAFSDADAYFSKTWSKNIKDFIAQNPGLDYGYTNEYFDDSNKNLYPNFFSALDTFTNWRGYFKDKIGSFLIFNNSIVSLKSLKKIKGFDDEWATKSEDTLLTLKLLKAGFKGEYYHAPVIVSPRRLIESAESRLMWCHDGNIKAYQKVNGKLILKPIITKTSMHNDISVKQLKKTLIIKSERIFRRLLILSIFEKPRPGDIGKNIANFADNSKFAAEYHKWLKSKTAIKKSFLKKNLSTTKQYEMLNQFIKDNWSELLKKAGRVIRLKFKKPLNSQALSQSISHLHAYEYE